MQVLSSLVFEGSGITLDFLTDFPEEAYEGKIALVDGVLYVYTTIGLASTWFPLTNKMCSYLHTQGPLNTTWTINHNLGIGSFSYMVLDRNNVVMENGIFNASDNDTFTLTFPTMVSGRCIVFYNADSYYTKPDIDALFLQNNNSTKLNNLLHIQDQKLMGTHGGLLNRLHWNIRDLNTVITNSILGASLSNNRITLPAGDYYVEANSPARGTGNNRIKLHNVTLNSTLMLGPSDYVKKRNSTQLRSGVSGIFTLTTETELEIQHYTSLNNGETTGGVAVNYQDIEIFSEIKIWRT